MRLVFGGGGSLHRGDEDSKFLLKQSPPIAGKRSIQHCLFAMDDVQCRPFSAPRHPIGRDSRRNKVSLTIPTPRRKPISLPPDEGQEDIL